MTIHSDEMWPGMLPAHVETFIVDTVGMIRELDDTDLSEMTPLFYQLGYEQVALALRELLTMLGHDPDA